MATPLSVSRPDPSQRSDSTHSPLDADTSSALHPHEILSESRGVGLWSDEGARWLASRPPAIKGARARGLGRGSVRDLADDEELGRMTTNELVDALKRSWVESDAVRPRPPKPIEPSCTRLTSHYRLARPACQTAALVADLESTRDTLQASNDHLARLVSSHDGLNAEAEADRARLEDELDENLALVDRLRDRVGALERETRDVGRRYAEQAKSFDAERQALYDNEQVRLSLARCDVSHTDIMRLSLHAQLLKSRLQTVSAREPAPVDRARSLSSWSDAQLGEHRPESQLQAASDGADAVDTASARIADLEQSVKAKTAEFDAVKADLALLERSYDSLQRAMECSSDELFELKQVNARLQVRSIVLF
jgi:hypothetical protein